VILNFQICLDISGAHKNVNRLKSWAYYLFPHLDSNLEEIHVTVLDDGI